MRIIGVEHAKSRYGPIHVPVGATCDKTPSKKCSWCAAFGRVCDVVPEGFFGAVNELLRQKEYLKTLDSASALFASTSAALKQKQNKYTKEVEAHIRAAPQYGRTSPPESLLDVGVLILETLQGIRHKLSISNELKRQKLSHASQDNAHFARQQSSDEWPGITTAEPNENSVKGDTDDNMDIIETSDDDS